jgi:hypothetical protein
VFIKDAASQGVLMRYFVFCAKILFDIKKFEFDVSCEIWNLRILMRKIADKIFDYTTETLGFC